MSTFSVECGAPSNRAEDHIPFHSTPFHSIPFHSIPFHSTHRPTERMEPVDERAALQQQRRALRARASRVAPRVAPRAARRAKRAAQARATPRDPNGEPRAAGPSEWRLL